MFPIVGNDMFNKTKYKHADRFLFASVGKKIINKTPQDPLTSPPPPTKDTEQTRVEVKPINLPKTTAYPRIQLPSKRQTPTPTERQTLKPTSIIIYVEDEYTSLSVESDPIQVVTP